MITGIEWAATFGLGGMLVWIAIRDWQSFTIPNPASIGLILAGISLSPFTALTTPFDATLGALIGYAAFALIGETHFRMRGNEALGLGDAKLLGAAGAWLGWASLPGLVLLASLSAMCFALLTRQRRLAFGPWLALAFWVFWIIELRGAQ